MAPLGNPNFLAFRPKPPYQIEQSLRFNSGDSTYLSRTPGSGGNRRTWTWSGWVKNSGLSNPGYLFVAPGSNNYYAPQSTAIFYSGSRLGAGSRNSPTYDYQLSTDALYRDPSAWMHIVFVLDTTQSTAADRQKLYVNGVEVTYTGTDHALNHDSYVNTQEVHSIGSNISFSPDAQFDFINCYMAELHFVDGTALDQYDFGEFDDNNVWRPIQYTGSYGTQGWYLKFDPTATNGIGHDHSGNGNNWTASGFSTSGTGTDVMSDTPTTNWCTLNPLYSPATSSNTPRNGNLEVVAASTGYDQVHIATHGFTSGKWYWEYRHEGSIAAGGAGIIDPTTTAFHDMMKSTTPSLNLTGGFQRRQGGTVSSAGVSNVSSGSISIGDVAMFAVDYDTGKVWVGTAGTWYNSGDPAAGTNPTITIQTLTTAVPFFSPTDSGSQTYYANWGQRAFEYTQPSGFKALNTSNLPAPEIADGSDYFNTITYTGDGTASRSLDNVGFAPDFVWIKNRDVARSNSLFDIVRGTGKYLISNSTGTELVQTTLGLASFDPDGFTLGTSTTSGGGQNGNGEEYVAWNWLAANGSETLTAGSIQSTVSANPTAGFSIVSYVGTQAADTIAHGLGVAPSMIICKDRDVADRWPVYHSALGNAKNLRLDNTTTEESDSGIWNSTSPTSTVFSVGTSVRSNRLNSNYIAYCFAEVEGYSKFGKFSTNNTSDNTFIYLGFKPAMIIVKIVDTAADNWLILDNKRNNTTDFEGNPIYEKLEPSTNSAASTATNTQWCDFLANGFKVRTNNGQIGGGPNYIYAAFAEHPFGGSGASPATAR